LFGLFGLFGLFDFFSKNKELSFRLNPFLSDHNK